MWGDNEACRYYQAEAEIFNKLVIIENFRRKNILLFIEVDKEGEEIAEGKGNEKDKKRGRGGGKMV